MSHLKRLWHWLIVLTLCSLVPAVSHAQNVVSQFQQQLTLSDPCAVFNVVEPQDPTITRIEYGENIDMDVQGTIQAIFVTGEDGQINLKFQINAHGNGVGVPSGIKYVFTSKALLKANTNGANPTDPAFAFNGKFQLNSRIIGQGHDASFDGIAQGAQDNALLTFYVSVTYSQGQVQASTSDFTLQCVASPWTDLMDTSQGSKNPAVGRGFGDPWNKYSWSMKDFNGGMIVGTKNAYFDYTQLLSPSSSVSDCLSNPYNQYPELYRPLACLELFDPLAGANTNFAQIWRFDYKKKTWSNVYDDQDLSNGHSPRSQGFRVMAVYHDKLYVGSDLGSFIAGVQLTDGHAGPWDFPGSTLLTSSDGYTFDQDVCTREEAANPNTSPCNYKYNVEPFTSIFGLNVNISFRSLAVFNGDLYLGTFNAAGAELWSYNDSTDSWTLEKKFNTPGYFAFAVTELQVYKGELYIGVATDPSIPGVKYLYRYDGSTFEAVPGQPDISGDSFGVLKLFVSSSNLLYIGNVGFTDGFTLLQYDGTDFTEVTNNGFFNPQNAYAWSMAEINGRLFVGTFNDNFFASLPRGSAELWYTDDDQNWQEMPLPLDWGLWNYGIRTMEVANRQLFLGSASNMVAPDLITTPIPLSPGTEVWTIRSTAVAPTGKSGKHKN